MTTGITLVIPAWNEEDRLLDTLAAYVPAFETSHLPFEVIVVTDGSRDRTPEVAHSFGSKDVRTLSFPNRLGKGGAVLAGMRDAQYDWVGFVDADKPVEPSDLLNLASSLEGCDCAIASRWVDGSRVIRPQPLSRVIMGRLWNFIVRVTLFLPVRDTQCGAKFFRRSSLNDAMSRLTVSDWSFDAALLFHLRVGGYTIREIPVTWTNKDGSKLIVAKAIPAMILSLISVRLESLGPSHIGVDWVLKRLKHDRVG